MQGLRSSRMHALAFQSLCFSSRTQSCTVSFLPFLLSSWPCLSVTSFLPDPSPGILVSPIFSSLSVPLPVALPFLLFYCICNELKFPSILLSFFSLLSHSLSSRPFLLCSPSLFFSRSLFLFLFPSAFSLYSLIPSPHPLLSPFPPLLSLSLLLSFPLPQGSSFPPFLFSFSLPLPLTLLFFTFFPFSSVSPSPSPFSPFLSSLSSVFPFSPSLLPSSGNVALTTATHSKGTRCRHTQRKHGVFGLWRVRFPPCLVRPGRRLPVQGLSEGSLGCLDRLPA